MTTAFLTTSLWISEMEYNNQSAKTLQEAHRVSTNFGLTFKSLPPFLASNTYGITPVRNFHVLALFCPPPLKWVPVARGEQAVFHHWLQASIKLWLHVCFGMPTFISQSNSDGWGSHPPNYAISLTSVTLWMSNAFKFLFCVVFNEANSN